MRCKKILTLCLVLSGLLLSSSVVVAAEWIKNTHISGIFLAELIYSNYNHGANGRFSDKNPYSVWCFPRANVLIDSKLSSWSSSHFAFNFRDSCGYGSKNDEWMFTKFDRTDEAYITLADDNKTPIYAKLGVQYMPYGHYTRHSIPATLTQLLTQTQTSGGVISYALPTGLNAAIYSFSSKPKITTAQHINNAGARVGYLYKQNDLQLNFNFDWMYNIAGAVNYIVHKGTSCANCASVNPLNSGYREEVGGIHLSMAGNYKKLDGIVQFTSALSQFDNSDLAWNDKGAKPAAMVIGAGYHFNIFTEISSRLGGSYQQSFQAVNVRGNGLGRGLPKQRMQADYEIEVWKDANLGAHLVWDQDYKEGDGGKGRSSYTTMLSLLVKI